MKELIDVIKHDYEKLTQWLNEKNYTIDSKIGGYSVCGLIFEYGNLMLIKRLLEQRGHLITGWNSYILSKIIRNTYTESERREQLPYLIQQGLCFAHPSFQDLCSGNIDAIKERYAQEPDYVFQQDSDQLTLIHYAAALGELEAFEWLASTVGMDVNAKTAKGYTTFQLAVSNGQLDVVRYLLKSSELQLGLNERVTTGECKGFAVLHLAMFHRQLPVLRYFLENTEFKFSLADRVEGEEFQWSGFTIFSLAVVNDDMDSVRYLLENWSENIDVNERITKNGDYEGMTPLHLAANFGFTDILRYLIEKCGSRVDVNKKTNEGKTALDIALEGGHTDIVRYLLENRTFQEDLNQKIQVTYEELTHLYFVAVCKGRTETVSYLIENWSHKFDVNIKLNTHDIPGCSVLHAAVLSGEISLIHYLLENPKFQGNIEAKTSANLTPLIIAFQKINVPTCLFLLEQHADVGALISSQNFVFYEKGNYSDGLKLNNALAFAQALHQQDYLKALDYLKQNALLEVNFKLYGESPLHLVIKYMHENPKLMMELLQELLKRNPKRLIQNAEGLYPIDIAVSQNQWQSITLLQTKAERFYAKSVELMSPLINKVLVQGFISKQEHFIGIRSNQQEHPLTFTHLCILLAHELAMVLDLATQPEFTLRPQQIKSLKAVLERYEALEENGAEELVMHYYLSRTESQNLLLVIRAIQYLNHMIFIAQSQSGQTLRSGPSDNLWISDNFFDTYLAPEEQPVLSVESKPVTPLTENAPVSSMGIYSSSRKRKEREENVEEGNVEGQSLLKKPKNGSVNLSLTQ